MGEIKSTLDLVMERTRNLTLSDEEKQTQKQKEFERRIKGLLQKYQDGVLNKNQLIVDYERFKEEVGLLNDEVLIGEILLRLDPTQDIQLLLDILEEVGRLDTSSIRTLFDDHRQIYIKAAQNRKEQLKEILDKQHAISGTAVLPNLEADEDWQRQVLEMRNRLGDSLSKVKDRLQFAPEMYAK